MCLLALEISTILVPCLAALSIATLTVNVSRSILTVMGRTGATFTTVWRNPYTAPMRIVVRFAVNTAVAIVYIAITIAISSFVSDVPNVSAGDIWRHPGLGTPLSPRVTRLGTTVDVVRLASCSYLRTMRDDISYPVAGGVMRFLRTLTPPTRTIATRMRNHGIYTHSTAETDEHYSAE